LDLELERYMYMYMSAAQRGVRRPEILTTDKPSLARVTGGCLDADGGFFNSE
jgi:hypothetical protein